MKILKTLGVAAGATGLIGLGTVATAAPADAAALSCRWDNSSHNIWVSCRSWNPLDSYRLKVRCAGLDRYQYSGWTRVGTFHTYGGWTWSGCGDRVVASYSLQR